MFSAPIPGGTAAVISYIHGAIGRAISGGLSFVATQAPPTTSSFLQSTTFNIFSETASQAGTSALLGDEMTLGAVLGSVAGGLVGSKMGNWNGIKGSWTKNVASEIGFNTIKGTLRGAVTGGVEAGFNGNNIADGMLKGCEKRSNGRDESSRFNDFNFWCYLHTLCRSTKICQ